MGSINDTEQEKLINALYLGRADNDSGHIVFELDTKAVVSVNRVLVISTPQTVIDRVNQMEVSEKQPERIQFLDKDGNVTIHNLATINFDNDNNKTSDLKRKWR